MNRKDLNIIGAGSLGSFFLSTSFLCANMSTAFGIRRIYVYDFDTVEAHNLVNQAYRPKDIDRYKVDAIREIIQPFTDIPVIANKESVNFETRLSGIVVVLVDNMGARQQIFEACRFRADIPYYVDARTGLDEAIVFAFDPRDPDCVARYEKTLYPQSEAVAAPCANSRTIPTLWAVANVIQECLQRFRSKAVSISLEERIKTFVASSIGKLLVRYQSQKIRNTGEYIETTISLKDLPWIQSRRLR
ncbi:MAG: ThiF family adenylyltransferase [Parcubacteria group bacterium]|nr:ThiF family adenylyltransferase [Parcubacteria group bacterium]